MFLLPCGGEIALSLGDCWPPRVAGEHFRRERRLGGLLTQSFIPPLRLLGLRSSNWKVQEPFNYLLELFVESGAKDGVVNALLVLMKVRIMDKVAT